MTSPSTTVAASATMSASDAPAQADYAFSLANLQRVAAVRFGMTNQDTLAAATKLYKRGLISYPRVEERELPESMFDEAARMMRDFKRASGCHERDAEFKGPVWVPQVRGEHIGITLTPISAAAVFGISLSEHETNIYGLVHERFLSLFVRPRQGR